MDKLKRFHPLTGSGHIFLASPAEILPGLKLALETLNASAGVVRPPSPVGDSLAKALEYLASACDGPFPSRFLILSGNGSRTVLFNNSWRSQGWFEMAFIATKSLNVEDVFFRAQPNTIRKVGGQLQGQYGAYQLIRTLKGQTVRSIELINDGGRWVFSTEGDPDPSEDIAQYEGPKKADRFTQALLEERLGAMNLFPFREDFYHVNASNPAIGIELELTSPLAIARLSPGRLTDFQEKYGPFD
jgi:hypothetical protein